MAIQILPRTPSVGEQLGTGLGSGLSSGIQSLANLYLSDIMQRKQAEKSMPGFQALGYTPEQAQQVSGLPIQLQGVAVKEKLRTAHMKPLMDLLGGLYGQQAEAMPSEGSIAAPQISPEEGAQLTSAILAGDPRLFPKTIADISKARQREKEFSYKQVAPELKGISNKALGAEKTKNRYTQLINLIKGGQTYTGRGKALIDKLELSQFFTNPETQLAQNLLDQEATNAARAYDTKRLTNLEAAQYKKSLGELWNTPEGLEVMAKNKILEAEADIVRNDAKKDVLKQYGGRALPLEITDIIEEKAAPKLKKLADEALENVQKASQTRQSGNIIGTSNDIPNPSLYKKGDELRNNETQQVEYVHNGTDWEKI